MTAEQQGEMFLNAMNVHLDIELPKFGEPYRMSALIIGLHTESGSKVGAVLPLADDVAPTVAAHFRALADKLDPPPGCRCHSHFLACPVHPERR